MTKEVHPHSKHRERMRERFLKNGFEGYAPHEVLEMLLYNALPRRDTNELAHRLVNRFGSVSEVLNAEVEELTSEKGVTLNVAVYLKEIAELVRLYRKESSEKKKKIITYTDMEKYVLPLMEESKREELLLVCLDGGKNIVGKKMWQGSVNRILTPVRELVRVAMSKEATSVIISHSHPGGFAIPSNEDDRYTQKLYAALMAVDIVLLEHLIVGKGERYSYLKENKLDKIRINCASLYGESVVMQADGGLIIDD